jgi:hypothetical protein
MPLWVKATDYPDKVVFLNMDLVRSMARIVGPDNMAQTQVTFSSDDQFTVLETPEALIAKQLAPDF